jgi:hypothetical protein
MYRVGPTAVALLALAVLLPLPLANPAQSGASSSVKNEPSVTTAAGPQLGPFNVLNLGAAAAEPKNIIFDDDYARYVDGIAAHYILLALERVEYAKVLAIVADSSNPYAAPAMAAVNKTFGRPNIPIGAYQGDVSSGSSSSTWTQQIVARFGSAGDVRGNYPDAVTTLRSALAGVLDGSVTYISTGFLTNLAALLQSSADNISPLPGAQLVTAKVAKIAIMGGDYPAGVAEFNFAGDPVSAAYVFTNSPVSIMGTGSSLGAPMTIMPPNGSIATTDPLTYALSLEGEVSTGAYDLLAVHYAVVGLQNYYFVAGFNGTNTVDASNGDNSWSANAGVSSYLGKALGDGSLSAIYNTIVASIAR